MGIITTITKDDLPLKYKSYQLSKTTDGVSASVYLLGIQYVLKIFENEIDNTIENEPILLSLLEDLKVPKIVDTLKIKNKDAIIFTQIEGESIKKPTLNHIKQIGVFLKKMHKKSKNKISKNRSIFEKSYLKEMIILSSNKTLLNYFNTIECELKNDGIIHGDLFCDNAKFKDEILTGVFDFSEACNGDFIFDLAVVAISWCFDGDNLNNEKLEILTSSYGLDIKYENFKEYIKYALVYYATTRYINNRDYGELLKKLENI